jgi:hypothetical protein
VLDVFGLEGAAGSAAPLPGAGLSLVHRSWLPQEAPPQPHASSRGSAPSDGSGGLSAPLVRSGTSSGSGVAVGRVRWAEGSDSGGGGGGGSGGAGAEGGDGQGDFVPMAAFQDLLGRFNALAAVVETLQVGAVGGEARYTNPSPSAPVVGTCSPSCVRGWESSRLCLSTAHAVYPFPCNARVRHHERPTPPPQKDSLARDSAARQPPGPPPRAAAAAAAAAPAPPPSVEGAGEPARRSRSAGPSSSSGGGGSGPHKAFVKALHAARGQTVVNLEEALARGATPGPGAPDAGVLATAVQGLALRLDVVETDTRDALARTGVCCGDGMGWVGWDAGSGLGMRAVGLRCRGWAMRAWPT